jgi:hypothetical protein
MGCMDGFVSLDAGQGVELRWLQVELPGAWSLKLWLCARSGDSCIDVNKVFADA